jgi:hypothetical protein
MKLGMKSQKKQSQRSQKLLIATDDEKQWKVLRRDDNTDTHDAQADNAVLDNCDTITLSKHF